MFKDAFEIVDENIINMKSEDLIIKARGNNNAYFTRNRKMNVSDIIKYTVALKDERNQLIKCMKYNAFRKDNMNISNQGINLQRLKLNPDAIKFISNDLVRLNYNKHNYERVRRLKDYYLLAIDGTDLILPNNDDETKKYFGGMKNKNLEFTKTMASASCCYDVINRLIVSSEIYPYRTSERLMALENIKDSMDIIPDNKKIYVFDRNYVSLFMMLVMFKSEHKFVFRVRHNIFKEEIKSMKSNDENIRIEVTQKRLIALRHEEYYEDLLYVDHMVVRCVKFILDNGEEEILLTNLENDEFNYDEIKQIYKMRWEIETVYNALKHKINLENFSGYKRTIIEQDFFASIYIWNMMQTFILDERDDINESEKYYIYEMKISDSLAIAILKERLINLFYEEDKEKVYKEIINEIIKYIEPVRPNRQYKRNIAKEDTTTEKYKEGKKRRNQRNREKKKAKRQNK